MKCISPDIWWRPHFLKTNSSNLDVLMELGFFGNINTIQGENSLSYLSRLVNNHTQFQKCTQLILRSSVFCLSKTYQCEDLASKPSVISSPFCSCLIHFQIRRYVIYYKYIFNIYKKVKSDRKSKNENWKGNSIRTD